MAAEAFDAEQKAARAAARRAGIERRAAEARERAERVRHVRALGHSTSSGQETTHPTRN
jgi:hypothetical protein